MSRRNMMTGFNTRAVEYYTIYILKFPILAPKWNFNTISFLRIQLIHSCALNTYSNILYNLHLNTYYLILTSYYWSSVFLSKINLMTIISYVPFRSTCLKKKGKIDTVSRLIVVPYSVIGCKNSSKNLTP